MNSTIFIGDALALRIFYILNITVIAPEPIVIGHTDGKWVWSTSELFVYKSELFV